MKREKRSGKRVAVGLLAACCTLFFTACQFSPGNTASNSSTQAAQSDVTEIDTPDPADKSRMEMEDTEVPKIEIILGGRTYAAVLDDTAAARQFVSMLPLTLTMRELNGNEKYHYLANALPTDAKSPSAIHAGDLMLFGTDCLVLFYKDFPTSYRYTSLGRIEDAFGLADAAGNADVIVTFRMEGSAS